MQTARKFTNEYVAISQEVKKNQGRRKTARLYTYPTVWQNIIITQTLILIIKK